MALRKIKIAMIDDMRQLEESYSDLREIKGEKLIEITNHQNFCSLLEELIKDGSLPYDDWKRLEKITKFAKNFYHEYDIIFIDFDFVIQKMECVKERQWGFKFEFEKIEENRKKRKYSILPELEGFTFLPLFLMGDAYKWAKYGERVIVVPYTGYFSNLLTRLGGFVLVSQLCRYNPDLIGLLKPWEEIKDRVPEIIRKKGLEIVKFHFDEEKLKELIQCISNEKFKKEFELEAKENKVNISTLFPLIRLNGEKEKFLESLYGLLLEKNMSRGIILFYGVLDKIEVLHFLPEEWENVSKRAKNNLNYFFNFDNDIAIGNPGSFWKGIKIPKEFYENWKNFYNESSYNNTQLNRLKKVCRFKWINSGRIFNGNDVYPGIKDVKIKQIKLISTEIEFNGSLIQWIYLDDLKQIRENLDNQQIAYNPTNRLIYISKFAREEKIKLVDKEKAVKLRKFCVVLLQKEAINENNARGVVNSSKEDWNTFFKKAPRYFNAYSFSKGKVYQMKRDTSQQLIEIGMNSEFRDRYGIAFRNMMIHTNGFILEGLAEEL